VARQKPQADNVSEIRRQNQERISVAANSPFGKTKKRPYARARPPPCHVVSPRQPSAPPMPPATSTPAPPSDESPVSISELAPLTPSSLSSTKTWSGPDEKVKGNALPTSFVSRTSRNQGSAFCSRQNQLQAIVAQAVHTQNSTERPVRLCRAQVVRRNPLARQQLSVAKIKSGRPVCALTYPSPGIRIGTVYRPDTFSQPRHQGLVQNADGAPVSTRNSKSSSPSKRSVT